jgi:hypothetical protein
MLLEIVLSRPVLGFVFARVYITPIDGFVSSTQTKLMDASLMPFKVVVGAEAVGRLAAADDIAFERPIVPGQVFPLPYSSQPAATEEQGVQLT